MVDRSYPPDPLPDVTSEVLRDARIALWADLWQRVERYEAHQERLEAIVVRMRVLLGRFPRARHIRRLEAQVEALAEDLAATVVRPVECDP